MPESRIVLYATPGCPHCAAARDALGAAGESFEVAAESKFKLRVREVADYCCSYVK